MNCLFMVRTYLRTSFHKIFDNISIVWRLATLNKLKCGLFLLDNDKFKISLFNHNDTKMFDVAKLTPKYDGKKKVLNTSKYNNNWQMIRNTFDKFLTLKRLCFLFQTNVTKFEEKLQLWNHLLMNMK